MLVVILKSWSPRANASGRTGHQSKNSPSQGRHSLAGLIEWLWCSSLTSILQLFSNFLMPRSLPFSPVASIHPSLSTLCTVSLALWNAKGPVSTALSCPMNGRIETPCISCFWNWPCTNPWFDSAQASIIYVWQLQSEKKSITLKRILCLPYALSKPRNKMGCYDS